ncbi:MAG: nucleotidyltransferase domain-containing protein, partial [Pseudonocardiaceae bacterium]
AAARRNRPYLNTNSGPGPRVAAAPPRDHPTRAELDTSAARAASDSTAVELGNSRAVTSVARGDEEPDSDIDLVVDLPEPPRSWS